MTKEEADKITCIMDTADGGCSYCAADLKKQFYEAFPEFAPEGWDFWKERQGDNYYD